MLFSTCKQKCVPWYLCSETATESYRYSRSFKSYEINYDLFKEATTAKPIQNLCKTLQTCCEQQRISAENVELNLLNFDCAPTTGYSVSIRGGSRVVPEKFPFLAALFLASNDKFFCGGSLITNKHVLTAAHCVQEKGSRKATNSEEVLVLLGRHNLAFRAERNAETRGVNKIIVHEDWKFLSTKYDADIAILVMDRFVTFSRAIRPICVASSLNVLSLSKGTVAGWGQGDSGVGTEDLPKKATVRAITGEKCFEMQSDLGPVYSTRMFCAKGDNASPCHGDSGSSFFVKLSGHWIATGIVSVGFYMLYTKIGDFTDWIKSKVSQNP